MNPEIFATLRNTLVTLYPEESDIRRLVADTGLDSVRINFNSTAINDWHSVLTEAEKLNRIDALLAVVEQEYGNNQKFRQACNAYLRGRNSDQRQGTPLFATEYLTPLLGITIGEVVLGLLFYQYRDQYLIVSGKYWLLAGLWIFVVIGWWKASWKRNRSAVTVAWLIIGTVITITWLGYLGSQVWAIVNSPKISPEHFGIAVATFGQGPNFAATAKGYEISDRLYRDLQVALEKDPGLAAKIELMRIGVVDSKETAAERGNDVNAKLVIWGYLVLEGSKVAPQNSVE